MSNLEEVKARGGPVIAIASEGDRAAEHIEAKADDVIYVPDVPEYLQPLVTRDSVAIARLSHGTASRLRCG